MKKILGLFVTLLAISYSVEFESLIKSQQVIIGRYKIRGRSIEKNVSIMWDFRIKYFYLKNNAWIK